MPSVAHQVVLAFLARGDRHPLPEGEAELAAYIHQRRARVFFPALPSKRLQRRLIIEWTRYRGFPLYAVRARRTLRHPEAASAPAGSPASARTILYLHGGAFAYDLLPQHWRLIGELAEGTDATVLVPQHPLAPEATWRDSYAAILDLARGDGPPIQEQRGGELTAAELAGRRRRAPALLAGDSSGGGYALAIAQALAAEGASVPMLLLSPWVDLTMTTSGTAEYERRDPWHRSADLVRFARIWAGEDDLRRPELSPLFGPMTGLGSTLIYAGTRDVEYPQAVALRDRLAEHGTQVELRVGEELLHNYPLLPCPEGRAATRELVGWARRHIAAGAVPGPDAP